MKNYYKFVRTYLALNKFLIMSLFGAFTTFLFTGSALASGASTNSEGLIDSVIALFSSPAAYLLFTAGASIGYGVSQRTTVKALKERLDEYKAAVDQFNKIRNDALDDKLKE